MGNVSKNLQHYWEFTSHRILLIIPQIRPIN